MSGTGFIGLFLFQNNILINVQVPRMSDKPEWNLNGQILAFTFSPTETVSVMIYTPGGVSYVYTEYWLQLTIYDL